MEHPFEIHALRAGKWKIDSIMDDREMAVEAAKALAGRDGIEAVRVIGGTFDPRRDEFANARRLMMIGAAVTATALLVIGWMYLKA